MKEFNKLNSIQSIEIISQTNGHLINSLILILSSDEKSNRAGLTHHLLYC